MLVKKAAPLPIECVARGYISGSGWNSYKESGEVCGIKLPAGLTESDRLPEPIFTPATKEELGIHDINIDFEEAETAHRPRSWPSASATSPWRFTARAPPLPSPKASSSPTPSSSSAWSATS